MAVVFGYQLEIVVACNLNDNAVAVPNWMVHWHNVQNQFVKT